jgi:putative N6-adenine-specific DNA methylase
LLKDNFKKIKRTITRELFIVQVNFDLTLYADEAIQKAMIDKEKNPVNKEQSTFFASCPRGLEEVLEKEIYNQGINETYIKNGGILFKSSYTKALRVLLTTRIASRIHEQVAQFIIKKEKDIYDKGIKINWTKIFKVEQSFKINTLLDRDSNDRFRNSLILSQILKDAIADQFRNLKFERPNVDTKNADISFLLRIEALKGNSEFSAYIFLDLAGEPLSNRGYRKSRFEAPLRENLAAGIIMHTDWQPEGEAFVDTMCGSGTLLIEAALIKGDIAPSYLKIINYTEKKMKPWSFLYHSKFLADIRIQAEFKKMIQQFYTESRNKLAKFYNTKFYGFDIDNKALEMSKENISNARLPESLFELRKMDATTAPPPVNGPGVVVCNPPYGERMNEDMENLITLYHEYGENLKKNWKNYKAYIFTGIPELRKNISLQTSKRIQLYNGNIECRLFRYNLF